MGKAILSTVIGAAGGVGYSAYTMSQPLCTSCNPVTPVVIGAALGLLAAITSR